MKYQLGILISFINLLRRWTFLYTGFASEWSFLIRPSIWNQRQIYIYSETSRNWLYYYPYSGFH